MRLNESKRYLIDIVIIATLSIMPFVRTGTTGIIDKTDADFPLYPSETFFSNFYLWDPQLGLGYTRAITTTPQLFPYFSVIGFLSYLGLPVDLVERVWLVSTFFLLGFSTYYLMLNLIPSRTKGKRIGCLIAAFFYMFNPFIITYVFGGIYTALLVHAAMPLFFAFVIKALNSKKSFGKYVLLAGFTSMAFQSANPGVTLITLIPIALYLFYHVLIANYKIDAAKSILFLVVVCFLLNVWWIIPMAQALSYPGTFDRVTSPAQSILVFASERLKLVNVVRLWTYFFEQLTPNLLSFLSSTFSVIVGFALAVLAYSALLLKPKNKYVLFFGLLATISTIFSLGIKRPWGYAYSLIWDIFPPFHVLRNPAKFLGILAFSYSILIGATSVELYNKLHGKFLKRFFVLCIIFLIAFNSSPLITGEYFIFNHRVEASIDQHFSDWLSPVHIPPYYASLREYLNNQTGEFNILILPKVTWYLKYTWSPYDLTEILKYISPKPVIFGGGALAGFTLPHSASIVESSYSAINHNSSGVGKFLGLMNIKYILVRSDIENYVGIIEYPASYVFKNILNSQQGIHLEKSFGELDLYKIPDEYFLPHIYFSITPTLINGSMGEMAQLIASQNFTFGKSIIFLSNQTNKEQWQFLENYKKKHNVVNNNLQITFKKINPTKYKVHVNASQPFFLVFSESYHPQWKAYAEDEPSKFNEIIASYDNVGVKEAKHEMKFTPGDISYLFAKPLSDDSHFLVNGYANAWYIDPEGIDNDGDGEFTVTLYFWPQSLFYLGLLVSGATFLGCVGYLGYDWRRKERRGA